MSRPRAEVDDVVRVPVVHVPHRREPHRRVPRPGHARYEPTQRFAHADVMDAGVEKVDAVAHLVERVRAAARSVMRLEDQHPLVAKLGEARGARQAADAAADDDGVEPARVGRELRRGGFVQPGPTATGDFSGLVFEPRNTSHRRGFVGIEPATFVFAANGPGDRTPAPLLRALLRALLTDTRGRLDGRDRRRRRRRLIVKFLGPNRGLREHQQPLRHVRQAPHARRGVARRADEPRRG